jgi:hypothetical protein
MNEAVVRTHAISVEAVGIGKHFGSFRALSDVSLKVNAGQRARSARRERPRHIDIGEMSAWIPDNFQPVCAGRKWSISLFDRMIHAPGTFRSARSCSSQFSACLCRPKMVYLFV